MVHDANIGMNVIDKCVHELQKSFYYDACWKTNEIL